jgi:hypothetical protein
MFSDRLLGVAQRPNLLSGYTARPPWEVAGVDYAVGVPAGQILSDWWTISIPGVTVNKSARIVTVTGNNVTLDSIDFSLHSGATVYINGASNTRITNSNFAFTGSGPTRPMIDAVNGAQNIYVGHNTMDGNGPNSNPTPGTAISLRGSQGLTVEYNWIKNLAEDVIIKSGT